MFESKGLKEWQEIKVHKEKYLFAFTAHTDNYVCMLLLNSRAKNIPKNPLGEKMGMLKGLTLYSEIYEIQQDILGVKKSTITFPLTLTEKHWPMVLLSQGKML